MAQERPKRVKEEKIFFPLSHLILKPLLLKKPRKFPFKVFSNQSSLSNYWPISIEDETRDIVGGADLQSISVSLQPDRFGNSQSAVAVEKDSQTLLAPASSYFEGNAWSISLWLKVIKCDLNSSALIGFGNQNSDETKYKYQVHLGTRNRLNDTCEAYFNIDRTFKSSIAFTVNSWIHLAATTSGQILEIYVNGRLNSDPRSSNVLEEPFHLRENVTRSECYIGRGLAGEHAHAVFDEIRFFSQTLSQEEVLADMNFGEVIAQLAKKNQKSL